MKRKIIVTINADEKTCGKCQWLWYGECTLHWKSLQVVADGGDDRRCSACLAAERKANGEGK